MKFRNVLYTFLAAAVVFGLAFCTSADKVNAEGPACPGTLSGSTSVSADLNAGIIDFDGEKGSADLKIVGGGLGFAPTNLADAACIASLGGDTFQMKEYAWNTNAGFVNFSNCPNNWCDVQIGAPVAGKRLVTGQAWNELFGYIYFNDNNPGDGIDYGVFVEAAPGGGERFTADSWAFSDLGVWLKFEGPSITLPEEDCALKGTCPVPAVSPCKGKAWVCIELIPDAVDVPPIGYGYDELAVVADGQSGYKLIVYLNDENGNPLVDSDKFDLDTFRMGFDWVDTVKLDQSISTTVNYNGKQNPVTTTGGVIYKPIKVRFSDLQPLGDGAYTLKDGKIQSIAPTSNMNLSKVSSVAEESAFVVSNDEFLWSLKDSGGNIWTDDIQDNELTLRWMKFELYDSDGNPVVDSGGNRVDAETIYPDDGKPQALYFRPAVEVNKLYADDNKDVITASRDVPFWISAGARLIGDLTRASTPKISVNIAYSDDAPETGPGYCYDLEAGDLDFYFGDDTALTKKTFNLAELEAGQSLKATAVLPSSGPNPCAYVQGASVYTEVSYGIEVRIPGGTKKVGVKYYSNHLPRIAGGSVSNTQIYVSGIVKGNAAYNTTEGAVPVTTSGNVNVSVVRSTIHENLAKYGDRDVTETNSVCTIRGLGASATHNCSNASQFDIGQEHVFYAKSDVSLKLSNSSWTGKWIIVSDGGHISIDSDVYNSITTDANHISLIAFRGDKDAIGDSGNVYIYPSVKNVQATTIADGSLLSCFGETSSCLSEAKGENGIPVGTIDKLADKLQNQLLYQGNIATKNTIGGFNYNKTGDFRLRASGEIVLPADETPQILYYTMMEDLDFLRVFKPSIQVSEQGLPIDQKCGMGITTEQQKQIIDGGSVMNPANGISCNGIDGSSIWSGPICNSVNRPFDTPCGDLYIDSSDDRRAKGVFGSGISEIEQNLPVLVIYSKIPDSVIFSKAGAVK